MTIDVVELKKSLNEYNTEISAMIEKHSDKLMDLSNEMVRTNIAYRKAIHGTTQKQALKDKMDLIEQCSNARLAHSINLSNLQLKIVKLQRMINQPVVSIDLVETMLHDINQSINEIISEEHAA